VRVSFERSDPQNIGYRNLHLCTMIVSIADVFDAFRRS